MVGVSQFLGQFPRFEVKPVHEVEAALKFARDTYCPSKAAWGDKQDSGIIMATAHLLEIDWYTDAAIVAASAKIASGEGGSPPPSVENDFTTTSYGRQFLEIRKTLAAIAGPFLIL